MDCRLPGSSVHGIFQARVLEWATISFSRRSSRPRDWTQVSHIVGRRFTVWATREVNKVTYKKGKGSIQKENGEGMWFSHPAHLGPSRTVSGPGLCPLPPLLRSFARSPWTRDAGDQSSIPGLGRFPWRRERLPTPVFWPGEFHGLYSPWGCRVRHDWATFTYRQNQSISTELCSW